ncbi:F-box/LRR-repeat protein 7-like isoform X3 [Dreissena polymorpha]|nr:F-box/LRR-repeat protein 7-like isoform X3 [Dreissena polymorpha]XP_052247778.1 F-box/LRR-repeat protein 7-like isoform X3 [Dreissena polymorpha]XP_052247786.1 F-box/LRR-repeat protein 7-like isoform X3 [Dreissena polymorpha]
MSESVAANLDEKYNINKKIFVGNISYRIQSKKLSTFFSKFGPVEYCYIVTDHLKGWSRGMAFVTFSDAESMKKALAASESELVLDSRRMRVQPAELSPKATYWDEHKNLEENESDHTEEDDASTLSAGVDILLDEILIHVFSMLSWKERLGIERVCWRWKHLVQRTWINIKHLSFKRVFKAFLGLTDRTLDCILMRCGAYLDTLDLSASPRMVTTFAMDIIGKHCSCLKNLDLTAVNVTDVSLRNLASKCTHLCSLILTRCLLVTDKGVGHILQFCKMLSHLDLAEIPLLTGKCFKHKSKEHRCLKAIVLTKCHKLNDYGLGQLLSECTELEELYISNCPHLSPAIMHKLFKNLNNLRVFVASGINLGEHGDEYIGCMQQLEHVDLSFSRHVLDTTIISLVQNARNIRVLDISGCSSLTDAGVISLAHLRKLQRLSVSYLPNSQVSSESIDRIVQNGQLHALVAQATKCVTDEVIISLATLCPCVEYVDVSGCFQITARIFEAFRMDSSVQRQAKIELKLGGTAIDWESYQVDWVSGFSHLDVSMHNLAINALRPDMDIILPSYDDDDGWEEGEDFAPHLPVEAYQPDNVDIDDDWDEDYYGDGFLENDDPLEQEQWNMS